MDDIKINGATFVDIEYISVPKADNSGNATFRSTNGLYEDSDFQKLLNGTITDINDTNGEITGGLRQHALCNADELQSVILPNVTSVTTASINGCDKLEYIQLDNCKYLYGDYPLGQNPKVTRICLPKLLGLDSTNSFRNNPLLNSIILAQDQVPYMNNNYGDHFISTSNNKNYVPSDLIKHYKVQNGWSTYSGRFRSIKQLDQDESDYVLYYISPILISTVNNKTNRVLCKYETSVETVYGRETYIVGRAQDTLTIKATCPGYVEKNTTVSLDSSTTTNITPDFSDMQEDQNFNGYNILYVDFCKFEPNAGVYGSVSRNHSTPYCPEDTRHKGAGWWGNGRFEYNITWPTYNEMTNPTFVFEANLYFGGQDSVGGWSPLFSSHRPDWEGGGICADRTQIRTVTSGSNRERVEINLVGHHHVAVVAQSSSTWIYVDGVLEGTFNSSYAWNIFRYRNYGKIGRDGDNYQGFNGRIKQLALCIRDIADPSSAQNCEFLLPIPQQAQS